LADGGEDPDPRGGTADKDHRGGIEAGRWRFRARFGEYVGSRGEPGFGMQSLFVVRDQAALGVGSGVYIVGSGAQRKGAIRLAKEDEGLPRGYLDGCEVALKVRCTGGAVVAGELGLGVPPQNCLMWAGGLCPDRVEPAKRAAGSNNRRSEKLRLAVFRSG
jgi:hypothetical protein